ncbi:hypothetical protein ZWY2020_036138 [Hordeum vulgare]|nr:hypothetical protein ZWY2020_036138 [Hordeum vulgare]
MAKGEKTSLTSTGSISMAAEGGGGKKMMVMLQSEDGKQFLLSEADARNCGRTIHVMMMYDSEIHMVPSDDGREIRCCLVRLSVQGDTLSKVVDFSNKRGLDLTWDDGNFDLDPAAFFDLILAADYLGHQGLLDQTCQTVAEKIHAMSPYEIRKKFNIRTDLNKNMSAVKPDLDQDKALTLAQNALKALHLVRCQRFTAYDPKRKAFVCTRFCSYNITFFDLDKESILAPGPPLDKLDGDILTSSVQSAVNVISLKVTISDVGKKLDVFGTVIARDQVDYKCLFLFKRAEADAQTISLPDGTLTLTDPCRGLVLSDEIIFEMDLKIKHDGHVEDFSRGMISLERARLPADGQQTMTLGLNSWLSRVELTCAHVVHPVEAIIGISILKGPCTLSRVTAWNVGNRDDCIILYDSEADDTQTVCNNCDGPVPLSRCLVAVPIDTKLVLHLIADDNTEQVFFTLAQSDDQHVCKMGLSEVQVKVSWRSIPKRKRYKLNVLGDECMLLH